MSPQMTETRTFPVTLDLTPDQAALIAGMLRQRVYDGRIARLWAEKAIKQLDDARTTFVDVRFTWTTPSQSHTTGSSDD